MRIKKSIMFLSKCLCLKMGIQKIGYTWTENWNKNVEGTDETGKCQNGNIGDGSGRMRKCY